jgi:two-component system sensor histidine kinase PilS (NtrC family)
MYSGLMSTDLEGKITELNPAGASILGYQPAQLRATGLREILAELQSSSAVPGDVATPQIRREITYTHPRGERRILGISESPLVVPELGAVGYVYNFQDLTEEKRREAEYRAKDRLASLGRLAAVIAHEIRNPLASIAGSVKLLRDVADLDDDRVKLIGIVSRESERLNKLASDFLLYSREQRFEFRDVDVVRLLEETLLLVEHHPSFGSAYRLERKLPRHPVIVCADADKIRQVFWNICDNSLKAMRQGGTLSAEIQDGDGRNVRVTLSDTGIGFTNAQLEKLFEPFQPGFDNGTGLGLAIVYQIVEGHRGRIQVESTRGKGARFLIVLPRVQPKASSEQPHFAGSAALAS